MCIYLDCGNAFTVYTCFIMHQIVHVKYVQFIILQLHINKDVMGFFFFLATSVACGSSWVRDQIKAKAMATPDA